MRAAFQLRVKAGMEAEYRRAHAAVWPSVLEACRRCGVRNYSIFMHGRDVFAYLEADDLPASLAALLADPEIQRWQTRMRPLLDVQLGAGGAPLLEEVFHLD